MNSISQISHSQTAWCWGCWGCWGSSTRICYTEEEHAKILRRIRKDPKGSERIWRYVTDVTGHTAALRDCDWFILIHIDSLSLLFWGASLPYLQYLAILQQYSMIFNILYHTLSILHILSPLLSPCDLQEPGNVPHWAMDDEKLAVMLEGMQWGTCSEAGSSLEIFWNVATLCQSASPRLILEWILNHWLFFYWWCLLVPSLQSSEPLTPSR